MTELRTPPARTLRARTHGRIVATGVLAACLAACGPDGDVAQGAALAELLAGGSGVTRIAAGADSVSAFDNIQDADITPDGSRAIIVDGSPPYVHILDRAGRGRAAFLDASARTIESVAPYAVAARDSQLLVMDGGLWLYDLDGRLLAHVPRPGILPFDAMPGCTDDWVIYGYGGKGGLPGRDEEWLQRIRFNSSGVMERLRIYADSTPPGRLGFGRPYSLARAVTEYAVLHENGNPPAVLRWSCGRYTPRIAPENNALGPTVRTDADGARTTTIAGDATPVGMAFVQAGLLTTSLRERTTTGDSSVVDTQFHLITQDSVFDIAVEGIFRLRSARFGQELLLVTDQPAPAVLLVNEGALVAAIRAGRARRRSD